MLVSDRLDRRGAYHLFTDREKWLFGANFLAFFSAASAFFSCTIRSWEWRIKRASIA